MTDYTYAHYCKCDYVGKGHSHKCVHCGAQGYELGNFVCIALCYFILVYGGIIAIVAFIINELAVY